MKAQAENGRTVELHDDGMWSYSANVVSPVEMPSERVEGPTDGFRNVPWSASRDDILRREGVAPSFDNDGILFFDARLLGKGVSAIYVTRADRLTRAKYSLSDPFSNKGDYLNLYDEWQKLLLSKYGPAQDDVTFWKNDLYKDDYQEWGMAVSAGHLVKYTIWHTEFTEISLLISGNNYEISVDIEYSSKALASLEEAHTAQANLADL